MMTNAEILAASNAEADTAERAEAERALTNLREVFVYMNYERDGLTPRQEWPSGSDVCEFMGLVFDAMGWDASERRGQCDTCGTIGTADDMIAVGGPCAHEDCNGTIEVAA